MMVLFSSVSVTSIDTQNRVGINAYRANRHLALEIFRPVQYIDKSQPD